jgi:hypothetical protein
LPPPCASPQPWLSDRCTDPRTHHPSAMLSSPQVFETCRSDGILKNLPQMGGGAHEAADAKVDIIPESWRGARSAAGGGGTLTRPGTSGHSSAVSLHPIYTSSRWLQSRTASSRENATGSTKLGPASDLPPNRQRLPKVLPKDGPGLPPSHLSHENRTVWCCRASLAYIRLSYAPG